MNCDAPIDTIERHPSVLRSAGKRDIERCDYCPTCWEQLKDDAYDSFWMTRRDTTPRKAPKLNRRERSMALRALFESLWDRRENEDVGPEIYLLAHLLMKWGGLKWRENGADIAGRPCLVFEDPASGDRIEIADMEVGDERLASIQQRIDDFLSEYADEDKFSPES
ncbi:MAG: hypothetical protein ABFD69_09035 [Candidatus Sumerlaeia bacterium]